MITYSPLQLWLSYINFILCSRFLEGIRSCGKKFAVCTPSLGPEREVRRTS